MLYLQNGRSPPGNPLQAGARRPCFLKAAPDLPSIMARRLGSGDSLLVRFLDNEVRYVENLLLVRVHGIENLELIVDELLLR
jgi:hypothetical protein